VSEDGYRVPAVVATSRIFTVLAELDGVGATLSEISRSIGRPKSSVFNLLSTLQAEGLVVSDPDSRRYHLGPRLIPLGAAAAREVRPLRLALDRARELASRTGLSVTIAQVVSGRLAQVVAQATPPRGLHVAITIGDRFGWFDGAIGKILLAGVGAERAAEIVAAGALPAHTPRTIGDGPALLADVGDVRRRGWATSLGELNENNAVAVAVHGPSGEQVLILAALGFAGQLGEDRIADVGEQLRALADGVSIETGGRLPDEEAA